MLSHFANTLQAQGVIQSSALSGRASLKDQDESAYVTCLQRAIGCTEPHARTLLRNAGGDVEEAVCAWHDTCLMHYVASRTTQQLGPTFDFLPNMGGKHARNNNNTNTAAVTATAPKQQQQQPPPKQPPPSLYAQHTNDYMSAGLSTDSKICNLQAMVDAIREGKDLPQRPPPSQTPPTASSSHKAPPQSALAAASRTSVLHNEATPIAAPAPVTSSLTNKPPPPTVGTQGQGAGAAPATASHPSSPGAAGAGADLFVQPATMTQGGKIAVTGDPTRNPQQQQQQHPAYPLPTPVVSVRAPLPANAPSQAQKQPSGGGSAYPAIFSVGTGNQQPSRPNNPPPSGGGGGGGGGSSLYPPTHGAGAPPHGAPPASTASAGIASKQSGGYPTIPIIGAPGCARNPSGMGPLPSTGGGGAQVSTRPGESMGGGGGSGGGSMAAVGGRPSHGGGPSRGGLVGVMGASDSIKLQVEEGWQPLRQRAEATTRR